MGIILKKDGTQLIGPVHKEFILVKVGIRNLIILVTVISTIVIVVLIVVFVIWKRKHFLYLQTMRIQDGMSKYLYI